MARPSVGAMETDSMRRQRQGLPGIRHKEGSRLRDIPGNRATREKRNPRIDRALSVRRERRFRLRRIGAHRAVMLAAMPAARRKIRLGVAAKRRTQQRKAEESQQQNGKAAPHWDYLTSPNFVVLENIAPPRVHTYRNRQPYKAHNHNVCEIALPAGTPLTSKTVSGMSFNCSDVGTTATARRLRPDIHQYR